MNEQTIQDRLDYLRGELRAERISYDELHELQDLAARGFIPSHDVELLEAAGVPELVVQSTPTTLEATQQDNPPAWLRWLRNAWVNARFPWRWHRTLHDWQRVWTFHPWTYRLPGWARRLIGTAMSTHPVHWPTEDELELHVGRVRVVDWSADLEPDRTITGPFTMHWELEWVEGPVVLGWNGAD